MFSELNIPFTEKKDEDGLPLEIERVKQNIPIGLKRARAFEIEYGIPFFQQLNIYQLAEELLKARPKLYN